MKDDPFYGTRFGKFVLLLLVAMLNSFLIGWGIFILAPDGGWLRWDCWCSSSGAVPP